MDVGERAAFAEIEEIAVIEEELRYDVVGAGVDFRFEVVHFDQAIRRRRMALGETGHTDPEAAAIGMRAGFVEFANELHQIARVLKRIGRFVVGKIAWPIAAERENVPDGRVGVALENRLDLFLPVTDAGQMRDRIQLRRSFDALDEVMREVARRAAGAVGDADEVRHVRFQFADRLVEGLGRLGRLRREELERERRGIPLHDVGDVHRSGVSLRVPGLSVNFTQKSSHGGHKGHKGYFQVRMLRRGGLGGLRQMR